MPRRLGCAASGSTQMPPPSRRGSGSLFGLQLGTFHPPSLFRRGCLKKGAADKQILGGGALGFELQDNAGVVCCRRHPGRTADRIVRSHRGGSGPSVDHAAPDCRPRCGHSQTRTRRAAPSGYGKHYLTALRAGPPFSWGVTSGGPPGGRSLSKLDYLSSSRTPTRAFKCQRTGPAQIARRIFAV